MSESKLHAMKQNKLNLITGNQDLFLALFLPVDYLTLTYKLAEGVMVY